jgi:hypothetical protein
VSPAANERRYGADRMPQGTAFGMGAHCWLPLRDWRAGVRHCLRRAAATVSERQPGRSRFTRPQCRTEAARRLIGLGPAKSPFRAKQEEKILPPGEGTSTYTPSAASAAEISDDVGKRCFIRCPKHPTCRIRANTDRCTSRQRTALITAPAPAACRPPRRAPARKPPTPLRTQ